MDQKEKTPKKEEINLTNIKTLMKPKKKRCEKKKTPNSPKEKMPTNEEISSNPLAHFTPEEEMTILIAK
ncbi:hypothetical protein BGZ65_010217, partial [Modicella reniformis]